MSKKSLKYVILSVILLFSLATSQLSPSTQEYMKDKALREIERIKGSQFELKQDLIAFTQASKILDIIQEISKEKDSMCKILQQGLKKINTDIPSNVFYLAQLLTTLKCNFLSQTVSTHAQALFKEHKSFTDIHEIYFLYKLVSNAKEYELTSSVQKELKEVQQYLTQLVEEKWISSFNPEDWSYSPETKGQGLSMESIKIAEMMVHSISSASEKTKKDIETKISSALKSIVDQAYEDENIFFGVTKNAGQLDSTKMNNQLLILFNLSQKQISKFNLGATKMLKYRNYFYQKALGAIELSEMKVALQALTKFNSLPFIKNVGPKVISLEDKGMELKFEFVDLLGSPYSQSLQIVKVQVQEKGSQKKKDITSSTKSKAHNLNFKLEEKTAGNYIFFIEVKTDSAKKEENSETYTYTQQVKVQDSVRITSLQYKIDTKIQFPGNGDEFAREFDKSLSFPQKIQGVKEIVEGQYLHLRVSVETNDPTNTQLYLSLQKKGKKVEEEKNLYVNKYAKYNSKTKTFDLTFDLKKHIEHFNGEYILELHAGSKLGQKSVWEMGSTGLWFKEGLDEGTNQGVRKEYVPRDNIIHVFPQDDENNKTNPILPVVGTAILAVTFLFYLKAVLVNNKANISKLSFIGIIFLLNILVILGIFIMFWFYVKLIPTLWILLTISPVSFFIINRGLISADCDIPSDYVMKKEKADEQQQKGKKNN